MSVRWHMSCARPLGGGRARRIVDEILTEEGIPHLTPIPHNPKFRQRLGLKPEEELGCAIGTTSCYWAYQLFSLTFDKWELAGESATFIELVKRERPEVSFDFAVSMSQEVEQVSCPEFADGHYTVWAPCYDPKEIFVALEAVQQILDKEGLKPPKDWTDANNPEKVMKVISWCQADVAKMMEACRTAQNHDWVLVTYFP